MPEAYDFAAVRHFQDGRLLEGERRVSNADQLFGFAAECAIKHALASVLGNTGPEVPRQHIERLWDVVAPQRLQRRYPSLVPVLRSLRDPFHDWSTDRRYETDEAVTAESLKRHRDAARRVLGSVGLTGSLRGE